MFISLTQSICAVHFSVLSLSLPSVSHWHHYLTHQPLLAIDLFSLCQIVPTPLWLEVGVFISRCRAGYWPFFFFTEPQWSVSPLTGTVEDRLRSILRQYWWQFSLDWKSVALASATRERDLNSKPRNLRSKSTYRRSQPKNPRSKLQNLSFLKQNPRSIHQNPHQICFDYNEAMIER